MSDIGSQSTIGIESVEWLDAGAGNLTVRVTGRRRRRRAWLGAETRAPAVLTVGADAGRQRFSALPEPPSLAGAAPGTWRLSFSIPGELAPELRDHAFLTLGGVTVALPVPESATADLSGVDSSGADSPAPAPAEPTQDVGPPGDEAGVGDAGAEVRPPSLEIERAWQRADAAERAGAALGDRVDELERTLTQETLRHDLAREQFAGAQARIAALEAALVLAEQQVADAAPVASEPPPAETDRLRVERALRSRRSDAPRVPAEPPAPTSRPAATPLTGGAGLPEPTLVAALRAELGARSGSEAALRARLVQAETRLAARVLLEQRTSTTLRELRAELERLGEALEHERGLRRAAEAEVAEMRGRIGGQRDRSRDVYDAIGEIRGALENLLDGDDDGGDDDIDAPAPGPAGAVTPERLSDALARLRETSPPRESAPEGEPSPAPDPPAVAEVAAFTGSPTAPTLGPALARLAGRDADLAGRLLLDLIGAQHVAYPHPVAYDLMLGPGHGCVQVTVGEGAPVIELSGAGRTREQVGFRVLGGPARLMRLLLAGRLRRLLRVGVARVRGDRRGVLALRALLTLPLDLGQLRRSGMRARPETLLAFVAAAIDPAWTRGERFTVALLTPGAEGEGEAAYLQVLDGRAPLVTRNAPAGRIAVSLSGPPEGLAASLAGERDDGLGFGADISGDVGALTVLRGWIDRARCG
jgi:hypothetical protein